MRCGSCISFCFVAAGWGTGSDCWWGVIGVVVLYAMWLVHLLLFRGDGLANWIGLLVVVQNIFTSLFNSHLFDFNEGWMYVLGVGVGGGLVLRGQRDDARQAVIPGRE